MSASTVSITANTAARRRPVVVGEKKSNLELFPNEALVNGFGGDDRVPTAAANSKDLSHHSIRGEPVPQVKKSLPNSTGSPRRTRKVAVTRPEKPLWLRVVSVFAKNFVLFLILIGLVQMVRKLAFKSGDPVLVTQMGLSELEQRIAEVERTMKTTSRMLQGQVEIVDKKIVNEVEGLRKEVDKKIEENGKYFKSELKKLAARSDVMEGLLRELNLADWLSKEEFDKFIEELPKGKIGDENGVSLDDLRAYARDMVVKEIEKHAADGLGRIDYALASGGATVVKHSEAILTGSRGNWLALPLLNRDSVHKDAEKMLKPSFGEPGQCFPLKGSSGFVQIRLRSAIVPEAVTLEHVAKNVAYDRSSAPKECRVSGWLHGAGLSTADGAEKMLLLTEFTYDLEKSNAQTFNILDSAASGIIDTVRFDFTSNHGHDSFTCIYRLRVHGHEPESVSTIPALA
ncbi:SUN domain-containing protein 3-like [Tripterygium wilfordii]|uniref:SUN domain-containing protein 3-like n=1 Tax=Tripterygium wilfordii TaxID=458696 RepID=A0A7J7BW74_TRIWF|nr:SUN domain-containing protein 1-like [Tripterygium wilfordii]KAF5725877.1 SUN domain-containing protein 3-like [Tripterygium wilfordii]